MKTFIFASLAVFLFTLGTPLHGGDAGSREYPSFDIRRHCHTVAGFSPQLKQGCLRNEGKAQAYLRAAWDTVPAGVRQRCLMQAVFGNAGSYALLRSCVAEEIKLKRIEASLTR